MNFKLFVFDLDGTLLDPDGRISPETLATVRRLRKEAQITLATGRSWASARPYVELLSIDVPVILYHGAVVFDHKIARVLREARLSGVSALQAVSVLERFPVDVQIYRSIDDPVVYVPKLTPAIQEFLGREKLPGQEVSEFKRLAGEGPLKLLVIGGTEILPELENVLRTEVPGINVVRSERAYLEILPSGISKGEALAWLSAHLRIPLEKVVTVGDQISDLSMIEAAGLGVAMAHAPSELREKAALVVTKISELPETLSWRCTP